MSTTTKKQIQMNQERQAKAPEFAKQVRDRNRKKADGGIAAVSHTVTRSRKHEAGESKDLGKPAKRRWQRASLLPAIPDPPGYHLEYVRRDNRNRGDNANISAHLRSGWEICRAADFGIEHLPTLQIAGYGEVIGNDDTILMKIDEEMWAERQAFYEQQRDSTTRLINQKQLRVEVNHPAMPIVDSENRHESGFTQMRGRRARNPQVASD